MAHRINTPFGTNHSSFGTNQSFSNSSASNDAFQAPSLQLRTHTALEASRQAQAAATTDATVRSHLGNVQLPDNLNKGRPIRQEVLVPGNYISTGLQPRDVLGRTELESFSKDLTTRPQPGMLSTRCCATGTCNNMPMLPCQVNLTNQVVPKPFDSRDPKNISDQQGYLRN